MKARYYVLMIMDDVEPELHGPFTRAGDRDSHARDLKAKHGDEHGIFPMDITARGAPRVGAYSGGFFMEKEI